MRKFTELFPKCYILACIMTIEVLKNAADAVEVSIHLLLIAEMLKCL